MSEARILREIEIAIGALPGVDCRRGSVMVTDAVTGRRRFLPGLGAGTPDLVLCVDGRWVGIEVKTQTGRALESQREFQRHVRLAGGVYELARSPADALAIIGGAR